LPLTPIFTGKILRKEKMAIADITKKILSDHGVYNETLHEELNRGIIDHIKTPQHPTHALRIVDNEMGDGDIYTVLAFKHDGEFYTYDSCVKVIDYEGDKILKEWELS